MRPGTLSRLKPNRTKPVRSKENFLNTVSSSYEKPTAGNTHRVPASSWPEQRGKKKKKKIQVGGAKVPLSLVMDGTVRGSSVASSELPEEETRKQLHLKQRQEQ